LQKQIERLEQERDAFNRECIQELASRLLRKVTQRTPVGKAPKLDGTKTVKVKGSDGKTRTFLSKNGVIKQKYWAVYQGGTLRPG
ncbi:HK97 gp10 family phage protein, partial [Terrisporobacter mayombei]|uniref:HK97 gp10 family phage protein n=1 Tax=Terrisporobacter mayombei TaxID=1541 RepID=UPI00265868FE